MVGSTRCRPSLAATLPAALFFAFVFLLAPSLHHDFACHQNSRTHCTSCITSQAAAKVAVCPAPVDAVPAFAGKVEALASNAPYIPALFSDTGRSPPASPLPFFG
jgi:hypothetical protein